MERKKEILKLLDNNNSNSIKVINELLDDFVYLEEQLKELRKLPKIVVNKENPSLQKMTPAAKLYKEYLVQYSNIIKIILSTVEEDSSEEDENIINQFFKNQEEFFRKGMQK